MTNDYLYGYLAQELDVLIAITETQDDMQHLRRKLQKVRKDCKQKMQQSSELR